MKRWEMEEQVAREMAERGWKIGKIRRSLQMPDWWVRRVLATGKKIPRVPPIDRPGVREALADICAGTRHQEIYDAHGATAFNLAWKLWMKGERA